MREVGTRRLRPAGFYWPEGPYAAQQNIPLRKVLLRKPCAVRRYRNHEEAQEEMEKLVNEEVFRNPILSVGNPRETNNE